MSSEGVSDQHLCSGVGIQQALVGGLEETLVRIEARLEKLVQELPKDSPSIDAGLVQAVGVEQMNPNPFLQVRL